MVLLYALLLLPHNKTIPLLRRTKPGFGYGLYSLPGGKVEDDETPRQAAVREAYEELGITLQKDDLVCVHVFDRKSEDDHLVAFVFKATRWQGELVNKEPEKHDDLRWFDCHALPDNLLPAHRQAIINSGNNVFYSEHGRSS